MDQKTLKQIIRTAFNQGAAQTNTTPLSGPEVEKRIENIISELEYDSVIKATYSGGE